MRFVPKANVRSSLAITILLTIAFSWVLSTGIANYLNYLNFRAMRQQMLQHRDQFPNPIPEPVFGWAEFFTGRPPMRGGPMMKPPTEPSPQGSSIPIAGPNGSPPGPRPQTSELKWLALRLVIALILAAVAASWLGKRFTHPLTLLAQGADEYRSGNFAFRIPAHGNNEFAAVADAMNRMAEQVSDQISYLERDAERRRQLLADIAHEIRSPVTTMCTMAGALHDGLADNPERQERAVAALVRTSERLQRLVQDLMELAKLDMEEFPLNARPLDLGELVENTLAAYETAASAAQVELQPFHSGGDLMVNADPDRIAQVLNNVIENAICYAGVGAQISVQAQVDDRVRLTIRDTGKGIRDDDLVRVLDPFYRVDTARTPGDYHAGLGLSIAYRLIKAHGGNLRIDSKQRQGTTVTITLPPCAEA